MLVVGEWGAGDGVKMQFHSNLKLRHLKAHKASLRTSILELYNYPFLPVSTSNCSIKQIVFL